MLSTHITNSIPVGWQSIHILYYVVSISLCSECNTSNSGIELFSSTYNGMFSACPGEMVIYKCTVTSTGVLQWAVESLHNIGGDSIIFSVQYDAVGTTEEYLGGLIIANVTEVMPYMVYLGNITSTLTVFADESLDNQRIWCSNGVLGESESPCIRHKYGGQYRQYSTCN